MAFSLTIGYENKSPLDGPRETLQFISRLLSPFSLVLFRKPAEDGIVCLEAMPDGNGHTLRYRVSASCIEELRRRGLLGVDAIQLTNCGRELLLQWQKEDAASAHELLMADVCRVGCFPFLHQGEQWLYRPASGGWVLGTVFLSVRGGYCVVILRTKEIVPVSRQGEGTYAEMCVP